MELNASPTLTGFPAVPFSREKEGSVKLMEEKTPAGQPIVDREKVCQALHITSDPPLNRLFLDSTLSHTRIRQSWLFPPPLPIPRGASPDRRRAADFYVVCSIRF